MTDTLPSRITATTIGSVAWRLIAFLLLWGALLALPIFLIQGQLAGRDMSSVPPARFVMDASSLLALGIAIGLMRRFTGHSTTAVESGAAGAAGHLILGLFVGLVLMAMVVVVLAIAGMLHRVSVPLPSLLTLGMVCTSTLLNAGTQELMFQGYVLPLLERHWGTRVALFASAGLFLLAHGPAAFTHLLPGVNLCLAGVLLGTAFLSRRSLWFSTGLHFGWNVLEGPLLGLSVSGHDLGGWRFVDASGPNWVTGGNFGPEGGFVATIVTLVGISVLWAFARTRLVRIRAEAA